MKSNKITFRKRKASLISATVISLFSVFTLGVSTFAWFQANSSAEIHTDSATANITVASPEDVKFYYFNGNGTPGTSNYYGYSNSAGSFGNTTNKINTSTSSYTLNGDAQTPTYTAYNSTWASGWTEININNATAVNNAFNLSKMRAGCYYSFCIYCGALCMLKR